MRSALSVHGHNITVAEVLKDGDTLTFLIVSQKVILLILLQILLLGLIQTVGLKNYNKSQEGYECSRLCLLRIVAV